MYIGSLIKGNSSITCSYSYNFRGTSVPLNPDLLKEEYNKEIYEKDFGKLFLNGPAGWKTDTLLDVGVDIVFNFSNECFIDHIVLNQGEGSCFKKIEVIKKKEEAEEIISCYSAETGKNVTSEEVKIFIGYNADNITIRVYSAIRDFIIKELDIYGALFDEDMLFPIPEYKNVESNEKASFKAFGTIVADGNNKDALFAASLLKEKLKEIRGKETEIKNSFEKYSVVFEEFYENDELYAVKEAFSLIAEKECIRICANDKRGFIYGAETLLTITEDGYFPLLTVRDKPSKEFRGMHIYSLPERKDLDFFKRYVKYMLLPLRYNAMVLEICGGMRYESHPEITEKWIEACEKYHRGEISIPPHSGCVLNGTVYEKSEVAELVRYISDLGIEVIPEIQSLGHVQYLTNAFPEIAEIPEKQIKTQKADYSVADDIPDEDYYHNYCISNEKTYEIVFDIMDEVIEVFKPERYVHMGHDEVSAIGVCPICKKKSPGDLLAYHINKLYSHLSKHNLKMMIWSDMLQNITSERTSYLHLDTMSAINKIPKDIVMCDFIWYFNLEHDIEDHLINHGFDVIMGNLYSSLYPRFDTRINKPHMIGGLSATWVDTNEYAFARDGKMYEAPYIANMLWSGNYKSDNRLTYNEYIKKLIPILRRNVRDEQLRESKVNIPLSDTIDIPSDLSNFEKEYNIGKMIHLSGKAKVKITVNGKFEELSFLHATDKNTKRICWVPLKVIGEYKVIYEDGSYETINLEYGGNICELRRGYAKPLNEAYYRHQGYLTTYIADPEICGKTDSGEDFTIYRYKWENPKPQLKITEIEAIKFEDNDADILLFSVDAY